MKAAVAIIRDKLFDTLWFLPGVLLFAGISLSLVLIRVDEEVGQIQRDFVFSGSPNSAREMMTSISSSLLTIIGVAVPLTIIALQLASSQFTQRILRRFMLDRIVQMFLGTFFGSFAYSLLVLRVIRSADDPDDAFVPQLAVTVGLTLALVSLGMFVIFVNHILGLVQLSQIVKSVGNDTRRAIEQIYPGGREHAATTENVPTAPPAGAVAVPAQATGYIQSIDVDSLVDLASEKELRIWVTKRVGEFSSGDAALFRVHGLPPGEDLPPISKFAQIGTERSLQQDALFGFRQLADIAIRALSTGINDPTTAVQCVDYLGALLLLLCNRDVGSPVHLDGQGTVRVVTKEAAFEDYVAEAFSQIREFGAGNIAVVRRVIEVLNELIAAADRPERVGTFRRQLTLVIEGARRQLPANDDLASLEALASEATELQGRTEAVAMD
jgi:uncharacterized membrane protein